MIEKDITDQIAYLIDAYTKGDKNFIEVDYGELLDGDTAGLLIANSNPKVRTLEVSQNVKINVDSDIRFKVNEMYPPSPSDETFGRNREITFNQLYEALSKIEPHTSSDTTFKASKGIIFIDVKNNIVTKIEEPYRP